MINIPNNEQSKLKMEFTLKISLVGDTTAGKSTFLMRLLTGEYNDHLIMTVGVDFAQEKIKFENAILKCQFWDMTGTQRFKFLYTTYLKGTDGVLLFFALNEPDRFQLLLEDLEKLKEIIPDIPILLIGTKSEIDAKISKSDIVELIQRHNNQIFDYIEISSKTGKNVNKVMEILLSKIFYISLNAPKKQKK